MEGHTHPASLPRWQPLAPRTEDFALGSHLSVQRCPSFSFTQPPAEDAISRPHPPPVGADFPWVLLFCVSCKQGTGFPLFCFIF